MRKLYKNLFLVGLLVTAVACSNDDDDDGNTGGTVEQPQSTPTPTPGSTPVEFKWASARFDEMEEGCSGFWTFTARSNGKFASMNPCNAQQTISGTLSEADQDRLDQLMNGITRQEANTPLACTDFNDDVTRLDQKVSMTTISGTKYALYTKNDDAECFSGTLTEVQALRDLLYEFRAIYVPQAIRTGEL